VTLGVGVLCVLSLGLSGCRHRMKIAPLPPIQTPVALEEIPPATNLPMLEMPTVKLPPIPIAAAAARPKRERRRPVAKAAPVPPPAIAPTAPANPPPAEESAIGALTAGGEADPQAKQTAADLIASIEKRLNALSPQATEEQKAQISKVRNFWRDAQEALKSGDAEGAMTLATKAKLLLDDLEK
jgi:ribosomal protein S20